MELSITFAFLLEGDYPRAFNLLPFHALHSQKEKTPLLISTALNIDGSCSFASAGNSPKLPKSYVEQINKA